jgi:hypothetical protein
MKELWKQLTEPLSSIREQPYHFTVWWLVANVFGLSGFWLPILLLSQRGGATDTAFQHLMNAGSLASFSVVLLADGVAATLVVVGGGSNLNAAGIRGLAGFFALLVAVIQVGVLVVESTMTPNVTHTSYTFQFVITGIAVFLASYLYCFRSPSWEIGVNKVKEEEDRQVTELGKEAESRSADETGVKL